MCWPQCSSTGFFCGLRYNPIRIQRLFLLTFSGKTEKVGLRSNSCSLTAKEAVPVNPDKRADVDIGPYKVLCRIACEQQLRPYRINGTSGANR